MLEVKQNKTCMQCGAEESQDNILRKIYALKIGENNIPLCSECLVGVSRQVNDLVEDMHGNIPNAKETEYDKKAFPKLQLLLNCKIAGIWKDAYQAELNSLDPKRLSNSNRVIYRQIVEW